MNISIGDIVDRFTICMLKSERLKLDNSKEIKLLSNEMSQYHGLDESISNLYEINGRIWDLESDIRKGNEKNLGLEEIGRRALQIRDLNSKRIDIKNKVNSKYNEGFIEIKMNHGSEKEPTLIISLTTVPERLIETHQGSLISAIESLCEQNDNDYEVHFNIPEVYNITKTPYIIPEWIDAFKLKYPHFKVFRTEDMGPPTKFIPTLQRIKNPETILLVVDDDLIYDTDMIKEHRKYQDELPNSVISYEGREPKIGLGYGGIRDAWILCVTKIVEVNIFFHYKSASYKKKLFEDDFYTKYVGKTFSDDILVSRYFNDRNVKIYVVPYDKNVNLFETNELWIKNHGVTTFPVLKPTSSNAHNSGCNHPGLLSLPNGARFYDPKFN